MKKSVIILAYLSIVFYFGEIYGGNKESFFNNLDMKMRRDRKSVV
jgi:hypothetical protein